MHDWIIITGHSKHELSTINMLYSLKEILLYHYNPNSP